MRVIKILHTADLHLDEEREERWAALAEIVKLGREEQIDVLVISGDLFDQHTDVERLRSRWREIWEDADFQTLILPGNHDYSCYREGLALGERVQVIQNFDEPVEIEDVRFWGMPCEIQGSAGIAARLHSRKRDLDEGETDILLFHGELLDSFFSRQDLGDEGYERYMPLKLAYLKDLPFDYVLAGHFHARFAVWDLEQGGYFVYPGSPVSVTRHETGPRKVNIFTVGDQPCARVLETLHYEEVNIHLDPWDGSRNPIEIVGGHLQELPAAAKAILSVKGFIDGEKQGMGEKKLVKEIDRIAGPRCAGEINYAFQDIRPVLESEIFHLFIDKIEAANFSEEKKIGVRDMVIRAMMGVNS